MQGAGRHMIVAMTKSVSWSMRALEPRPNELAVTCYYCIARSGRVDISCLGHCLRATDLGDVDRGSSRRIHTYVPGLSQKICDRGTIPVCKWSIRLDMLCIFVCGKVDSY